MSQHQAQIIAMAITMKVVRPANYVIWGLAIVIAVAAIVAR